MYSLKNWTVSPTGVVVPAVVDPGALHGAVLGVDPGVLPGAVLGAVPGAEGNR